MSPSQLGFLLQRHHIFLTLYVFCLTYQTGQSEKHKVLVVVFGGFHHDLVNLSTASGFGRLKNLGFMSDNIRSEFVTSTGPNLFSISTGLHSAYHGIVDDVFFDPVLNATFDLDRLSVSSQIRWFPPEVRPIWMTAQQQGGQSIVTSHWPGAESPIHKVFPTFLSPPTWSTESLNTTVEWTLDLLKHKANLGLIYHSQPKFTSQRFGTRSPELQAEVGRLDEAVDQLVSTVLASPGLKESLNVIITSDHGMTSVDKKNIIVLDEFVNHSQYKSPGPDVRAVWPIWPEPGVKVHDLFIQLVDKSTGVIVRLKEDMTGLYHGSNKRIAPIVAYAAPGYLIARSKSTRDSFDLAGIHGYDPACTDMSPFLMAFGPGINRVQSTKVPKDLHIVDLYPLMCHLLNLDDCGRHNGSLARLEPLLRRQEHKVFMTSGFIAVLLVVAIALTTATLTVTYACRLYCYGPARTSAMTQRQVRQRRKSPSRNQSLVMTSRRHSETPSHVNSGQLLTPVSDEEELLLVTCDADQEGDEPRYRVDDATLTKMLHGARSRYP